MTIDKLTITLTTHNRIDLLERTLDSFFGTNTYPIDEFLLINDYPYDVERMKLLISKYNNIQLIQNTKNIGQRACLDLLFSQSTNEYIFHMEDDWLFDNNSNYIENSIKILKNDPYIHQVWIRHEHDNPHPTIGNTQQLDDIEYKYVVGDFNNCWNGYSWNPGARRKSDYLHMFPNGLTSFKDEMECANNTKMFAYKAVLLLPTVCQHIGYNRSTQ